jgi:hypothetical protein
MSHLFWWALTWACVVWYSTLTFYVAWKGFHEIQTMLQALKANSAPKVKEED